MNTNDTNGGLPLDTVSSSVISTSVGYGLDNLQRQGNLSSTLSLSNYGTYTVQPGDTLWDISKQKTGNPLNWTQFREADGTTFTPSEARRLQIGSTVFIPKDLITGQTPSQPGVPNSPATPDPLTNPIPALDLNKYVPRIIRAGDRLWNIAQAEFGDAQQWIAIRESDGTNFSDYEARRLQIASTVYLPKTLLISNQNNEQSNDFVISPTTDLRNYLDSRNNGNQPDNTLPGSNLLPNPSPDTGVNRPNLSIEVSKDSLLEGKSFNFGIAQTVVIDDSLRGTFTLDLSDSTNNNVDLAFLDPNYSPTINIQSSLKGIALEFETDIFTNLLKWNSGDSTQGSGFSLKIGQWNGVNVWLSNVRGQVYDPVGGAATTSFRLMFEGDFTNLVTKYLPQAASQLGSNRLTGELEYSSELAWQPNPLPAPVLVPIYVNPPVPVYIPPGRLPGGISSPFPINPPVQQPVVPPSPIQEPVRQPVIPPQPVLEPARQPSGQSVQQASPSLIGSDAAEKIVGTGLLVLVVGGALYFAGAPVLVPLTLVGAGIFAGAVAIGSSPFWGSGGGDKT